MRNQTCLKCAFWCLLICLMSSMLYSYEAPYQNNLQEMPAYSSNLPDQETLRAGDYIQNGQIRLIIECNESEVVLDLLSRINGQILTYFPDLNFISVEIPYGALPELERAGLEFFLDRKFHACLNLNVPIIKPAAEWTQLESYFGYPINGSGIRVAVLDTGIEDAHPDLNDLDDNVSTADPKILAQVSFVEGNANPDDDSNGTMRSHGTHIAGIIGGTGENAGGVRKGVAPGCYLLNAKVLNYQGTGYESWILSGIQWALTNNADVINLSLATNESGDGTDPMSVAIANAVRQGVTVILAAGNKGVSYSIGQPGVCAAAITVGASDGNGIAPFSSQGPTYDFRLKPDLVAPGVGIESCDSTASGYLSMSGTSQAAAFVAGAVALLLQTHPTWSPELVKAALITTAKSLGAAPYQQGMGRVYIPAAINTSVVLDPIADFTIFKEGINNKSLTIRNLRSYPLNISYATQNFTLDLSNPTVLSALGSINFKISAKPDNASLYCLWEYINFTVEGKSLHLFAGGLKPTLTLSCAPSIRYNSSFNLVINLTLDSYPVSFLHNSYLNITANGSALATVPITTDGNFSLPLSSPILYRGMHEIALGLYLNQTFKRGVQHWLKVVGWNSSLWAADLTCPQGESLWVDIMAQNTTGNLLVYRRDGVDWVYFDTIPTSNPLLNIHADYPAGTQYFKVIFEGNAIYEPSEYTFSLTVQIFPPWVEILLIVLGVCGVAVLLTFLIYRIRKEKGPILNVKQIVKKVTTPLPPAPKAVPEGGEEQIEREMRDLVKIAQISLEEAHYETAAKAYRDASRLAAKLEKNEMARIYAEKSEEILKKNAVLSMDEKGRDAGKSELGKLPNKDELDNIKEEIAETLRNARKALRANDSMAAAKLYRKVVQLYKRISDEEKAKYFEEKASKI